MISILVLLLEWVLLVTVRSLGIGDIGNVTASLMIIIFSISFFITVQNSKCLSKYSNIIILGYMFRVFLLYFDLFANGIFVLPNSGADSIMFYNGAVRYMEKGGRTRGSFPLIMGTVFRVIGQNRLFAQFLVMLCSIVAILCLVTTVDMLNIAEKSKRRTIGLICLLPNFAILSSVFLRESIVTMFVTISACLMIRWMIQGGTMNVLMSIGSSFAAAYFHSGSIGITIGCVMCLLLYNQDDHMIRLSGRNLFLAIILALGVSFVFLRFGENFLGKFANVDSLEDIANTSEMGGSSYARFVGNSNNPLNMVIFTLPRIVYFLFSPFPWQWRGLSDIIAFFFSGLYYLVVIKDIISFLCSGQRRNRGIVISLLMLAFFTTFIFAWGTSNTGTAARHRDKMVCLYGALYALTNSYAIQRDGAIVERQTVSNDGTRYIR